MSGNKKQPLAVLSLLFFLFPLYSGAQDTPSDDFAVLVSPKTVVPHKTFRILVASGNPHTKATITAAGPSGSLEMLQQMQGGGPPYWWTAIFKAKGEGTYKVWLVHESSRLTEKIFLVSKMPQALNPGSLIWQTEHSWTLHFENLYAAWIERLFLDKEEGRSWDFLHHVMQDAESNLLHNYLGLDEDGTLILNPVSGK